MDVRRGGWLDGALAVTVLLLLGVVAVLLAPRALSGAPRIVDGDTIELAGRRIRFAGMDAPELGQSCENPQGSYPCGEVAREALRTLIGEGSVICRVRGRDRYGRDVAICERDSRDLGGTLVRRGLAVAYGGYEAEEREARVARLGLWGGSFIRPAEWRRQHAGANPPSRPEVR